MRNALQLCQILDEMSTRTSLFSEDASKDFSQNRILSFQETLTIILGMAGGSLNRELYDHFKTTSKTQHHLLLCKPKLKSYQKPSSSFFMSSMNISLSKKTFRDYKLYATDGTDLNFPTNPNDPETYLEQGFNQLHINALYDLLNRTYVDADI